MITQPVHPLGVRARVLLTSVFGPFAQDDEYGSRTVNPMELYHNQVTRVQGAFSLRMFHRSFGLMFIQANLKGPCTLLDFPTLERFLAEIRDNRYDVIGISGIIPNVGKVKKMCELIRQHSPSSAIVVGGHVVNHPTIETTVDADHLVKGDGIRWFRRYLKQDEDAPVRHPRSLSGFNTRTMGKDVPDNPEDTAAILIPSVGCPVGCNFCATSALFGGKGNFINFYETGDELFQVMVDLETDLGVNSFFCTGREFPSPPQAGPAASGADGGP
ncbi:MAG: cobalamin-dependent protein [Thermodesulfobacteriota bacterium]